MENNNNTQNRQIMLRNQIFPLINSDFVDSLFKDLNDNLFKKNKIIPNYPPIDIYQSKENFFIEIVAAGFSKDEINISIENKTLTVETKKKIEETEENSEERLYNIKTISRKNFIRTFGFMKNVENVKADFNNGILVLEVIFEQDNKNVKTITIN